MCGIIGYVGRRPCKDLLLQGLQRLEYRGYDSAGLALREDDKLDYVRAVGNLQVLKEAAGSNGPRRSGVAIGSSRASLHGKTFVFDRTSVFIGSVNLDPRSLEQNTEVGVLVQSPELAAEVGRLFDHWASPALAYEVTSSAGGRLQWTGGYTNEPEAGFWRPLGAKFFSHLPIDSLL